MHLNLGYAEAKDVATLNSFEHCVSKIIDAFRDLSEKERLQVAPFYQQFLFDDEKLRYFAAHCWANFYNPYYKCGVEWQYPSPCKFEVQIPLTQANRGAIYYAVVLTGAQTGDKVVALYHHLIDSDLLKTKEFKPFDISCFAKTPKKVENPVRIDLNDTQLANLADYLTANGEQLDELAGKNARSGYRVVELTDEPCIRFPCYNLPLQCAQQMAYEDVGLQTYNLEDIWDYMVKNDLTEIRIRRTPLDIDAFDAMLNWSIFEILGLKPKERMLWVVDVLKKKDRRGKANKADALYKRVTRYFQRHLASQKPNPSC